MLDHANTVEEILVTNEQQSAKISSNPPLSTPFPSKYNITTGTVRKGLAKPRFHGTVPTCYTCRIDTTLPYGSNQSIHYRDTYQSTYFMYCIKIIEEMRYAQIHPYRWLSRIVHGPSGRCLSEFMHFSLIFTALSPQRLLIQMSRKNTAK
jgi:hypothetical protein